MELLQLEQSGIRVAEYVTELPPRELLQQKLHAAISAARRRIDNRAVEPDLLAAAAGAEPALPAA